MNSEAPSAEDRDRAGLTYSTEIWAADRLMLWANGRVDPTEDRQGYRITRDPVGWSWSPGRSDG